jgi:hypothetical protein
MIKPVESPCTSPTCQLTLFPHMNINIKYIEIIQAVVKYAVLATSCELAKTPCCF